MRNYETKGGGIRKPSTFSFIKRNLKMMAILTMVIKIINMEIKIIDVMLANSK